MAGILLPFNELMDLLKLFRFKGLILLFIEFTALSLDKDSAL